MNFWKKIFGTSEPASNPVFDKQNLQVEINTENDTDLNQKLVALIDSVRSIGHHENPLLRKEYAVSSRMPCQDFSLWVSQQIKEKDFHTLWLFVKTLYNEDGNPQGSFDLSGMVENILVQTVSEKYGITSIDAKKEIDKLNLHDNKDQAQEESSLKKAFDNFFLKKFSNYIIAEDKIILELQSFFILNKGIDDFNREFWISEGKEAEVLAKILSVYSLQTKSEGFEFLIAKANKFLKEMKRNKFSKDYWKSYRYYKNENIDLTYSLVLDTDLAEKLKSLSVGERLHFFDYGTTYSYRNYWNGDSTYKTRSSGINEADSLQKIIDLNVFEIVKDIECIPEITSKGELKEKAEKHGLEIKKSWTFDKMFLNLKNTTEGLAFLNDFIKNKKILKFKPEYKSDLAKIIEYQGKIKIVADLLSMA
jgi:hypothetical protein